MKVKISICSWTTNKVYTLGGGDIGYIIGEREFSGQNNTDKWYHYDRLGNVMAQSNSSGSPSTYFDQDAFGNVLSGSANGYHLTTKDNHTDVGLYYFYQRWYDPVLGRFVKIDIIKSDLNLYSYCNNNPVKHTDLLGLSWMCDGYFCDPPWKPTSPADHPLPDPFNPNCAEACEKAEKLFESLYTDWSCYCELVNPWPWGGWPWGKPENFGAHYILICYGPNGEEVVRNPSIGPGGPWIFPW